MPGQSETIRLLTSIDASLKQIARSLQSKAPAEIASDDDLDGQYGDPELKFTPRDWTGEDFKGCNFSQCPAELLDMVAKSLDYFAKKSDEAGEETRNGKPVGDFKRRDAARARGWARRIRNGWSGAAQPRSTQAAPASNDGLGDSEWPGDDEIPF